MKDLAGLAGVGGKESSSGSEGSEEDSDEVKTLHRQTVAWLWLAPTVDRVLRHRGLTVGYGVPIAPTALPEVAARMIYYTFLGHATTIPSVHGAGPIWQSSAVRTMVRHGQLQCRCGEEKQRTLCCSDCGVGVWACCTSAVARRITTTTLPLHGLRRTWAHHRVTTRTY